MNSAIDTCGYVDIDAKIKRVADLADMFLLDVKHADESGHIMLTGRPPEKPRRFLEFLCEKNKSQTGFCRTGRMFATNYWEESGVQPDILATAKSIAAGVPLSAIVAREEIMEASAPGTIGGTFCGNALACAAALKTIEIMERDDIAGRSCEIGEKVSKRFNEWKEKYPVIGDVRGLGGMIGLEFVKDQKTKEPYPEFSAAVIKGCAQKGLMIEGAGTYGNVIRFLAPLVMTDEQLEAGLDIYESVIKELLEK